MAGADKFGNVFVVSTSDNYLKPSFPNMEYVTRLFLKKF